MKLYYTGEESGNPEVTFLWTKDSVDAIAVEFDSTAQHILAKDYSCRSKNAKLCENCDFRHYCKN